MRPVISKERKERKENEWMSKEWKGKVRKQRKGMAEERRGKELNNMRKRARKRNIPWRV